MDDPAVYSKTFSSFCAFQYPRSMTAAIKLDWSGWGERRFDCERNGRLLSVLLFRSHLPLFANITSLSSPSSAPTELVAACSGPYTILRLCVFWAVGAQTPLNFRH